MLNLKDLKTGDILYCSATQSPTRVISVGRTGMFVQEILGSFSVTSSAAPRWIEGEELELYHRTEYDASQAWKKSAFPNGGL